MKRWPIIRHARYYIGMYRVNRHYDQWMKLGYFPTHAGHDYAILDHIWRGER